MNNNFTSSLQAALALSARDWPVLPLCWPDSDRKCACKKGWGRHNNKQVGKAPLTKHGCKDATLDTTVIRDWWSKWPEANVGVALGPAGLLVIDVDSQEADAEAEQSGLPPTLVRQSRFPAYIYSRPDECPELRAAKWGANSSIDILADNYLVVSGTHATGVDVYLEDLNVEVAPAPQWAVEVLTERARRKRSVGILKLCRKDEWRTDDLAKELDVSERQIRRHLTILSNFGLAETNQGEVYRSVIPAISELNEIGKKLGVSGSGRAQIELHGRERARYRAAENRIRRGQKI